MDLKEAVTKIYNNNKDLAINLINFVKNKDINSFSNIVDIYIKEYPITCQDKTISLLQNSNTNVDDKYTKILLDKGLYTVIAEMSEQFIIEKITLEKRLTNCDFTKRKDQDFLKQFICPRVMKILSKKGIVLHQSSLDYLSNNFDEYDLKELVNDKQTLFDFLIEKYDKQKITTLIPLPHAIKRELRNEIQKPDYKYNSIQEEKEIYKKINTLLETTNYNDYSVSFLIEALLSCYNKGINKELIDNFIDNIISVNKKTLTFYIELNNKDKESKYLPFLNKIKIDDISTCTDTNIIHEIIHYLHFNNFDSNTPSFYSEKDGIKDKIKNYKKLNFTIKRLLIKFLIEKNKSTSKIYKRISSEEIDKTINLAKKMYSIYSNSNNYSVDMMTELYKKIKYNRYKIKINNLISGQYIGILDAILEGDIFSKKYDSIFLPQHIIIGHEKEYFKKDNKLSFAEFIAEYLSMKLTNPNFEEIIKDFYKIIGPENTNNLEKYSNQFIKSLKK